MTEPTFKVSSIRNWKAYAAVAAAGAGLLLVFHYANALSYSAEPITAVVVDAETRQVLESVNVLVLWDLEDPNGRGGPYWIFEETVTDKEGRFQFPVVQNMLNDFLGRVRKKRPQLHLIGVVPTWISGHFGKDGAVASGDAQETFEILPFLGSSPHRKEVDDLDQ